MQTVAHDTNTHRHPELVGSTMSVVTDPRWTPVGLASVHISDSTIFFGSICKSTDQFSPASNGQDMLKRTEARCRYLDERAMPWDCIIVLWVSRKNRV